MPVEYRIDKVAGIVHTRVVGELTDDEALVYQRGLRADPDFDLSYREFFDFSEVESFPMTPRDLQMWADRSPWGDGAQRAFVAPRDFVFGMLRIHQRLLESRGQEVSVFRTASEAWQWLEQAEE